MTRRKCRKCNGDVEYCKMGRGSLSLIFFLTGGCMMWIPILGWIAAPICFISAILMLLVPTCYYTKCVRCDNIEGITKEEYEEVMK